MNRQPTLPEAEAALFVNKNLLDDELTTQPEVYYRVAEAASRAAARRDSLKYDLELMVAEVDAKVRDELADEAEADQDSKRKKRKNPTEIEIANLVKLAPKVEKAHRAYMDARLQAAEWEALTTAFGQRSYVLKDLTALYVANYYQVSEGDSKHARAAKERVAGSARDKMASARDKKGYVRSKDQD